MNNKIEKCRACGGTDLWVRVNLGDMAFTGIFKPAGSEIPRGKLALVECQECSLVQLDRVFDPNVLYGETYGYRSGLNASMVKHLQSRAKELIELVGLRDGVVIDIGSSDGTLLNAYPSNYYRVGVDPQADKYKKFYNADILTYASFFQNIAPSYSAKIITTIAMFYDINDPIKFAKDIKHILHPGGIWNIEMLYLPDMSFDAICHEHATYYNLESLSFVLKNAGLKIVSVELNSINGGSFSVIVRHEEHPDKGLIDLDEIQIDWVVFNQKIDKCREKLIGYLYKMKEEGKIVYGLGASTKGNVLLQYIHICPELLPCIVDVNLDKKGCVTPGTGIPIAMEEELPELPDAYIVFPWHFKENIIERIKKKEYSRSVDLVFPLPEFEIVTV